MNAIVHFEIGGTDTEKSAAFYSALFGWKVTSGPVKMIEGAGLTGHLNALGHEPLNYTVVYVGVEDIKRYMAKAESLGAKTMAGQGAPATTSSASGIGRAKP